MFRVYEIKNYNRRGKDVKKIEPITKPELFHKRGDERSVPYFSIVREQFMMDRRIKELFPEERGTFLRLCVEIWGEGGLMPSHNGLNADRMEMTIPDWKQFQEKLVSLGLLVEDDKAIYLTQPELREQYIQFLDAHPGASALKVEGDGELEGIVPF